MSEPHTSTAYELGYCAAATGRLRKVPSSVRRVLPSVSPEWFRSYDDAGSDNEADRVQILTGFGASD